MSMSMKYRNTDGLVDKLLEKWLPRGFAAAFAATGLASLAGFAITGMWHCLLPAAISAAIAWAVATGKEEDD